MPHDAKGNELKIGDRVIFPGTLISIQPGEEYCNCHVEMDYPMPPYTEKVVFQGVNTKQLLLVVEGQGNAATD